MAWLSGINPSVRKCRPCRTPAWVDSQSMRCSVVRWARTTPFGNPVVPDVKKMKAGSSGSRSGGGPRDDASPRQSPNATVPSVGSPSETNRPSEGSAAPIAFAKSASDWITAAGDFAVLDEPRNIRRRQSEIEKGPAPPPAAAAPTGGPRDRTGSGAPSPPGFPLPIPRSFNPAATVSISATSSA